MYNDLVLIVALIYTEKPIKCIQMVIAMVEVIGDTSVINSG